MNLLYSKMHTFSSASPTVAEESSSRYRYQNMNQRPILTTATKVQMNLNPRYISKVPTKVSDTNTHLTSHVFTAHRSQTTRANCTTLLCVCGRTSYQLNGHVPRVRMQLNRLRHCRIIRQAYIRTISMGKRCATQVRR